MNYFPLTSIIMILVFATQSRVDAELEDRFFDSLPFFPVDVVMAPADILFGPVLKLAVPLVVEIATANLPRDNMILGPYKNLSIDFMGNFKLSQIFASDGKAAAKELTSNLKNLVYTNFGTGAMGRAVADSLECWAGELNIINMALLVFGLNHKPVFDGVNSCIVRKVKPGKTRDQLVDFFKLVANEFGMQSSKLWIPFSVIPPDLFPKPIKDAVIQRIEEDKKRKSKDKNYD